MNSTKKYSSQTHLSREEIASYSSSVNEANNERIDKQFDENSFEKEALEGWAESGIPISVMSNLDKKFAPKRINWTYILSGVVVIAIISSSLFFIYNNSTANNNSIKSTKIELSVEKTDVMLPLDIEEMDDSKSEVAIPSKLLKATFKNKVATPENIQTTVTHQASELILSDLPILKKDIALQLEESATKKIISNSQAKEIYLHDLKLVDYRAYRSKPEIKAKSLVLSGVSADFEDEGSKNKASESEWKDIQIPYYDYLNKTQLLFSQEKFKYALSRYVTILETYPDDVNALFYSGLCYYNLGEFTLANKNFGLCLNSKFNNFNEEAEWFMAQSYFSMGESQKARAILQLIIDKNGYYFNQAKKQLKLNY